MPDYSKSKVYNIVCNITGQTYYGSTVQKISQRMNGHRNKVSKCLSKPIIERGDYHYGLVEDYKCDNLEQLLMRERYYIDNNDCVNKNVPGRTKKERYEANKDKISEQKKVFYEANKDKISERNKVYNEANKDKISERNKGYYEANKDKRSEQRKVFYEANKDKISEYGKQKVVCECGCELSKCSLYNHRKTKFHQEFIQSLASGGNTI